MSNRLFLIAAMLAVVPGVASAHAFLDHAVPKVGSSVSGSPSVVKIWFTQPLEPAFSVIQVFDDAGIEVDKRDSHVDDHDQTLLIVSLKDLPVGLYHVKWHVVSVDTHRTQGGFKFTVK
ncbi:MAG TPA: copper resistance protein CopC [Tepidisphaeraceae bacterium]|nr:copper resistance protein CopC [Tepidisphaeraceae bacterium]